MIVKQAMRELQLAQRQFDQAEGSAIDVAIYRLQAAELNLEAALKEVKENAHRADHMERFDA